MKLFVTNKVLFHNTIDGICEQNEKSLNAYLTHQRAFDELHTHIHSKNSIPLTIVVETSPDEYVFFVFKNKNNDIYYYEFQPE